MKNNSSNIINELMKNNPHLKEKVASVSCEDIKRTVKSVNKAQAIVKLREMGLTDIASKLQKMSDDELISVMANNPAILKKLNNYFK